MFFTSNYDLCMNNERIEISYSKLNNYDELITLFNNNKMEQVFIEFRLNFAYYDQFPKRLVFSGNEMINSFTMKYILTPKSGLFKQYV